jgi:hypothetical protein
MGGVGRVSKKLDVLLTGIIDKFETVVRGVSIEE